MMKLLRKVAIQSCIVLTVACTSFTNCKAEEIDLPEEVQQICIEVGEEFDFCPAMLMAIVWQESRGLLDNATQITYEGWFAEGFEYTGNSDKYDMRNNIRVCAYYMKKWGDEYKDINISLTGWTLGIENSLAVDGKSNYATVVIKKSREYERIWNYGRNGSD